MLRGIIVVVPSFGEVDIGVGIDLPRGRSKLEFLWSTDSAVGTTESKCIILIRLIVELKMSKMY
jgi:hypothetical protein